MEYIYRIQRISVRERLFRINVLEKKIQHTLYVSPSLRACQKQFIFSRVPTEIKICILPITDGEKKCVTIQNPNKSSGQKCFSQFPVFFFGEARNSFTCACAWHSIAMHNRKQNERGALHRHQRQVERQFWIGRPQ